MPRSIDARLDFLSPISVVPGLGSRRTAALNESGIFTLGDLLYQFPRRYVDRSKITPISECRNHIGSVVNVIAEITKTRVERGRRPRFRIQLTDATSTMEALWFAGVPFFRNTLCTGQRLLCTGVVSCHTSVQMIHPQTERLAENAQAPEVLYLPVYPLSLAMENAGMGQKLLRKAIGWALRQYAWTDPKEIARFVRSRGDALSGLSRREALKNIQGARAITANAAPSRSARRA